MSETTVSIAEAKARLSELAERAAHGESVIITKRGKPAVRLSRPVSPRQPIALARLRRLTSGMPRQQESAGDVIRKLRDEARY